MEFQRHFQRHRWLLAIVACSLLILASIAALAGCSTPGSQGDTNSTSAQSSPTIKTPPPPLTNGTPSHQALLAGGFAAVKPHLAGTPSFSTDDMKQYVLANAIIGPDIVGPDHGGGQPTVAYSGFLSCAEIDQRVGGGVSPVLSGCGEGTRFGLVIESGGFILAGPGGGPHTATPQIFLIFAPDSGNLLMYGSLAESSGGATATPTGVPTQQPGQPTATPAPHLALTMKPTSAVRDCGSSSTTKLASTTLTLDATASNVAVSWTATVSDKIGASSTVWATLSKSSGIIAAGHTTQITVTPASAICNLSQNIVPDASYHVVIHYNSGHTLTFTELVKSPTPG